MTDSGFLNLPERTGKPRSTGLTHVLDNLMPLRFLHEYLEHCAQWVDIVKVGWGLAHFDSALADRAALCRKHGIALCIGGTFLEVSVHHGKVAEFRDWALSNDVSAIEVSNGLGLMTRQAKHDLVARLVADFLILAETGSKDSAVRVDGGEWAAEMKSDLDAGATWVVAEGRESGTVGLYEPDGEIRAHTFAEVVSVVDPARIIFEAPRKAQQAWLINRLGPNVNLGNVALAEVPSVESLRVGLRADTALRGDPHGPG